MAPRSNGLDRLGPSGMKLEPLTRRRSPPLDLEDLETFQLPVIATNKRGMIVDPLQAQHSTTVVAKQPQKRKRRTLQYVSRHFAQAKEPRRTAPAKKRRKVELEEGASVAVAVNHEETTEHQSPVKEKLPQRKASLNQAVRATRELADDASVAPTKHIGSQQQLSQLEQTQEPEAVSVQVKVETIESAPARSTTTLLEHVTITTTTEKLPQSSHRIFFGLDVDALSSDSDLSDVPDNIGPDPFLTAKAIPRPKRNGRRRARGTDHENELVAVKEEKRVTKAKLAPKRGFTKSPYFPHAHKPRPHFLSTLPFPPLDLDRFGLMQERLCHDPFRLLLATIFLNKTPGARAMPIFFKLMEKYPTPEKLAQAVQADVTEIIHELGFQNQRAAKCIAMARRWIQDPPVKGRRWRKKDYPVKGDGKDIKPDEIIADEDERVAWEISHLPGLGPYSHDSWRMFCRDELRGLASAYNGENAQISEGKAVFEPEWKRVLPTDKELRAWMTWMWMKEGYVWNKETGQKTIASPELMELAKAKDNVVLESEGNVLQVKSLNENQPSPMKLAAEVQAGVKIETPAGNHMS